ncbi:MAG TPA: sn-glycerol-3-phosphate ABC transporter ATP-binding protein UgpC [Gammaproteobacteria bacterium]|nr:sn-glycerol-3-phosphate ABC transporter ATP-binding protein UgpC [Gammaproteobacteria bacterium]
MAEIVLDRIGKRFDDGAVAVRDVSCTIRDGELFVLVGPSGCGKSTLLALIVGLETPTEGEIRIDGRRANDVDARDRNMAMVFQSYALYPHMTVRENLAFPLRVARMDRDEIARRVAEAAALLELDGLLDRRPANLSGGQRQRVAMGRAIVRKPAVFLLDEPLSNLDARLREQMRTEVARLQKRLGTTTVFVTHDQAEAMTLGDRVAVLRAGRVEQLGTPRELYDTPVNLFVATFVGAPRMNLMPGRVEGDRAVLPIGDVRLDERLRGALGGRRTFVAGIRPEHLREAGRHASASSVALHATAELVEWLGAETYVHFTVAAQGFDAVRHADARDQRDAGERLSFVARTDGASAAVEDRDVDLAFEPRAVHWFDAATGERLGG